MYINKINLINYKLILILSNSILKIIDNQIKKFTHNYTHVIYIIL